MAIEIKRTKDINPVIFEEPKLINLSQFVQYCTLYDYSVSQSTGKKVDSEMLRYEDSYSSWQLRAAQIVCSYMNYDGGLKYYYSCVSPYFSSISSNKPIKHYLLKQYIFYETQEDEHGWIIILRCNDLKKEGENTLIVATGQDLLSADLDFNQQRISQFKSNIKTVKSFLELNIPVTKEQMLAVCKRLDTEVRPESVKYNFQPYQGGLAECSCFTLSCNSKDRKFYLEVEYSITNWIVTKYIPTQEKLVGDLAIIGEGKTLDEAFFESESKYQNCLENPAFMKELIASAYKQEQEEDREYWAKEGEAHINWLMSEYGEDAFPDRD